MLPALQPSGVAGPEEMNRHPPRAFVPGFPYGGPDASGRDGKVMALHRASSNTALQQGKRHVEPNDTFLLKKTKLISPKNNKTSLKDIWQKNHKCFSFRAEKY